MRLDEVKSQKSDYWELLSQLGVDSSRAGEFHDAQLPWVNHNNAASVNRLIKVKDYQTISHLRLYVNHIKGVDNFGVPVGTIEDFHSSLDNEITVWRGGGGKFDPGMPKNRAWVSCTLNRDRANTFSEYDGTYARRGGFLDKRSGEKWIVEIKLPLREVLLVMHAGQDHEVIVPKSLQKSARIIVQT